MNKQVKPAPKNFSNDAYDPGFDSNMSEPAATYNVQSVTTVTQSKSHQQVNGQPVPKSTMTTTTTTVKNNRIPPGRQLTATKGGQSSRRIETFEYEEYDDFDDEDLNISRRRFIQTIFDFVVILIIFLIFGLVFFLVDPKIRYFTCDQSDVFYPQIADTVPFWAVGIFGIIGPLVFIMLVELINARVCSSDKRQADAAERRRQYFICLYHAISLFLLGIALTLLLTEIGKRWAGRLRPYFMSVCLPVYSQINCTSSGLNGVVYNSIYTGDSFCRGDASAIKEARLSFPSGHASFSTYTMGYLIIYLEARLYLLRFRYVKPLIQMAAFIAAFVTSLSRIVDYHHRGSDVIGGAVLGGAIALMVTLVIGRVLWDYGRFSNPYYDFSLRPTTARPRSKIEI